MFPKIVAILFLPNLLKKYRTFNYFYRLLVITNICLLILKCDELCHENKHVYNGFMHILSARRNVNRCYKDQ